jgi:hypothetical protein
MGHMAASAAMDAWVQGAREQRQFHHILEAYTEISKMKPSFCFPRCFVASVFLCWVLFSREHRRVAISQSFFLRLFLKSSLVFALRMWQKSLSVRRWQELYVFNTIQQAHISLAGWTLHQWRHYILERIRWAVTVHRASLRARRLAASYAFHAWTTIVSALAAKMICFRRLAGATRRHCAGEIARFHRSWARQAAVQVRRRCHAATGRIRMLQRVVYSAFLVWRQFSSSEREAWIAATLEQAKAAANCIDASVVGIREGIYQVGSNCCVCLAHFRFFPCLFTCFSLQAMARHHCTCNRQNL